MIQIQIQQFQLSQGQLIFFLFQSLYKKIQMKAFSEVQQKVRKNRYQQSQILPPNEKELQMLSNQKIARIHSKPEIEYLPQICQIKSKFKLLKEPVSYFHFIYIFQVGSQALQFKEEIVGSKLQQSCTVQEIERPKINPLNNQFLREEIQRILSTQQPGHLVFHPMKLDPRLKSQQMRKTHKNFSTAFEPFKTQKFFGNNQVVDMWQSSQPQDFVPKKKKLTKSAVKYLNDNESENSVLNLRNQAKQIIYGQKIDFNCKLNQFVGFENDDDDDIPLDMIFKEKKNLFIKEKGEDEENALDEDDSK